MGSDIKKNYIYNVVYRLSSCFLPLIVTPYIAQVLGAERGVYTPFPGRLSLFACLFLFVPERICNTSLYNRSRRKALGRGMHAPNEEGIFEDSENLSLEGGVAVAG